MDHRHDRYVEPDHGPHLGAVVAGRVDHVVGDHPALVGDHLPAAVGQQVHVGDQGVAGDRGTELAGPGGHRVGGARRVGPPVTRGPEAESDVADIFHDGNLLGDLGRAE